MALANNEGIIDEHRTQQRHTSLKRVTAKYQVQALASGLRVPLDKR
jgi:hypothetical protein